MSNPPQGIIDQRNVAIKAAAAALTAGRVLFPDSNGLITEDSTFSFNNTTKILTANILNTPAGNIAATNVQAAINELDAEKLALTGGTMTGTLFGTSVDLTVAVYVDTIRGAGNTIGMLKANAAGGLGTSVAVAGNHVLCPVQQITIAAPPYIRGGIYFDTTLNRDRVGGSTIWNDVVMIGDNVAALTPGATVALDVTTGADVFTLAPTGNETINAATVKKGQTITIIFTSRAVADIITFGTNFKSTGTLTMAGVAGKIHTMMFVSDGTNYNEISRTAGM